MRKNLKSGIFRSYKDMDSPDKGSWIKEMAKEIRIEQAKKEEELARKKEMAAL